MAKQEKKSAGRPATGHDPTMSFRAPTNSKRKWAAAAKKEGTTLSKWIVKTLDAAVVKRNGS